MTSISQFQSLGIGGQRYGPHPPVPATGRSGREDIIVQGGKLADVPHIYAWVPLGNTFTYSQILTSGQDRWDMAF